MGEESGGRNAYIILRKEWGNQSEYVTENLKQFLPGLGLEDS